MGVYTFGCVLTVFLQCSDVRMMWDLTVKGTCWTVTQIKILGYLNTVLNMITDLAFSVGIPVSRSPTRLPAITILTLYPPNPQIPMLWGVQMNRRHKASLICILGLGLFATAASMIKLSYIGNYGRAGDLMWDSRNLTIWTVQECNVGMVAGNLPCLKPLFRSILVSTYGKGSRKTSQPKYLSDAYAAGTKERSTNKSYGPLGSPKLHDRGFFDAPDAPVAHDALGKSYMLTTIDATHAHQTTRDAAAAPSVSSSGRSSPAAVAGDARSSTESFARLHRHQSIHGRGVAAGPQELGNITVTTEVNVSESVQSPLKDPKVAQLKAKDMV